MKVVSTIVFLSHENTNMDSNQQLADREVKVKRSEKVFSITILLCRVIQVFNRMILTSPCPDHGGLYLSSIFTGLMVVQKHHADREPNLKRFYFYIISLDFCLLNFGCKVSMIVMKLLEDSFHVISLFYRPLQPVYYELIHLCFYVMHKFNSSITSEQN